jgi:hypothetical protein
MTTTSSISDLVEVLSNKETAGIGINTYPDASGYINYTMSNGGFDLKQGVTHLAWIKLFSAPNTIQNIRTGVNDKFYYINTAGTSRTITLPAGFYQITDYNTYIQSQMQSFGDTTTVGTTTTYYITIATYIPTLQVSITLSNNFKVDFTQPNTIASNYGFNNTILTPTVASPTITFLSPNVPNVFPQDTILVSCDLVQGIYYNGVPSNIMEMIPANVPSGYLQVYTPNPVNEYVVIKKKINQITIRITDQNNLPILSTTEKVKLFILIKQV